MSGAIFRSVRENFMPNQHLASCQLIKNSHTYGKPKRRRHFFTLHRSARNLARSGQTRPPLHGSARTHAKCVQVQPGRIHTTLSVQQPQTLAPFRGPCRCMSRISSEIFGKRRKDEHPHGGFKKNGTVVGGGRERRGKLTWHRASQGGIIVEEQQIF